ncbi:porin [Xanthobacter oligotrophicus]|uniref:Porin n=1 Tax=Xanthobacter oligotrophicus TaxID=2607286 RepID=A0ABW6ZQT9_9HYPH
MLKTHVKWILAAGAASLAMGTATGAGRAADLPAKAKPAEYVKVCAAYGTGFYYVPGTDTCLKVGGYARMDTYLNVAGVFLPGAGFNGPGVGAYDFPFRDKDDADYFTLARAALELDARTQTDYGILRSYFLGGVEWNSQRGPGQGPGPGIDFERAFIQFGNFTFGYTQSFFDTGIAYSYAVLFEGSNTWNTVAAYTAQFGNGFSASFALEDAANRTTGVQATGASISAVTTPEAFPFVTGTTGSGLSYANYQAGQQAPDLVANLRLDQAWGSLQIAGALHQVQALTPAYLGAVVGTGSSSTWGYALGAYAEFKLPMLAPGDSLYLQANYSDGALNYVGLAGGQQSRATGIGAIHLSGSGLMGGAYYPLADAVMGLAGSYETVSAWALQAQFRHFWTPTVRSAAFGGYVDVDVPANVVGAAPLHAWQLGCNTIWSPARSLDIGAELVYTKVGGDQPLGIVNAASATGGTIPTLVGGTTDALAGAVRIQRTF